MAALEAEIARRPGHNIKRAEQALMTAKAAVLREFELTVPQYAGMVVLSYLPGTSGAQLARICAVTPQTMATVLSNLEAKGLVTRTPSSVHQKVFVTKLTRAGNALIKRADVKAHAVEDRLVAEFSDDERRLLADLLERAIKVLNG
ncbi:MarR family winged helix-turn-helix transcriptional regulator [Actinokineospora sp.]|uniref:MarR family winged helix-turn-helix transcriptional regulator n=1 Tax=Actinokineospora sp. TaxID=1872133 RepID=UPI004037B33F